MAVRALFADMRIKVEKSYLNYLTSSAKQYPNCACKQLSAAAYRQRYQCFSARKLAAETYEMAALKHDLKNFGNLSSETVANGAYNAFLLLGIFHFGEILGRGAIRGYEGLEDGYPREPGH
eukprot:TRINITY_DN30925_c0_g1_i1.p1 TRINITY_DN30925_c0_g1~~TRINITY_DN30925_c0_g1_i1.p1  ORF type:complete len:121 (-),score=39.28 TRINITY_DN30925_c0_g1_i1:93-455(-)